MLDESLTISCAQNDRDYLVVETETSSHLCDIEVHNGMAKNWYFIALDRDKAKQLRDRLNELLA